MIEAKYLKPIVHSLMKVNSVEINEKHHASRILLVSDSKENLKHTRVLKYIKWGERERFNEGSTCQSRAKTRNWYDLAPSEPAEILWPLAHQYRHVIPYNKSRTIPNKRFFDVHPHPDINTLALCAILNSSLVALMKSFFGRFVGREGNLDTEVSDAVMMLVPDPRLLTPAVRERLESALNSMRGRQALPLVDVNSTSTTWTGELALEDRQQLDDAVLELLGIADAHERAKLRCELYEEITKLYRQIRVAERKMQRHRSATARGGRATPHSIAEEIWENLETPFEYRTPPDFIPKGTRNEQVDLPAWRAHVIRGNMFQPDSVQIGEYLLELGDPVRCQFVKELNGIGISGVISVPVQPEACGHALNEYNTYVERTTDEFMRLAAADTAEEAMQERVAMELWKRTKM